MMWIAQADVVSPQHHLVLSPHYDDAALSCGGLIALLSAHSRRPQVTVVFGAEPDPSVGLTDFAAFQHERWGMAARDVIAARRQEEAAALQILGAESRQLPFTDAIYRGDAYTSDSTLFSLPVALEAALPSEIVKALGLPTNPDANTRVYAPLALGGHVDHRHARVAGELLVRAGWDIWFYEDQPYAIQGDVETGVLAGEGLTPLVVDISDSWERKIAAILAYPSQNPVIFRHIASGTDSTAIERALAAYSRQIGRGERKAERFWRRGAPARERTPEKLVENCR